MIVAAFAATPAVAQNSYTAQPGNSSLFGNGQTTKTEKTYNEPGNYTGHFGLGIRLGAAQNDPKDMKDLYDVALDYDYSEKELTRSPGVFGLEALYEFDLADEANKVGVKLGLDFYGQNKLTVTGTTSDDYPNLKITESTYAVPLTVYYKRDHGIKNWSWFAGAGLTWIHSEVEYKGIDGWIGRETDSKSKVFPHITAGAEYRFSKLFALGLDLKYNIAAKVTKDGAVLSDRSGIGAALTGRFYF